MPHTVQTYSLLDNTFGSYGQQNFSHILLFAQQQSNAGRTVVFYPETAYWVNVDISQGLSLPIYIDRRLNDYRILEHYGVQYDGVHMFHSGFEWGYWYHDFVLMQHQYWDWQTTVTTVLGGSSKSFLLLQEWVELQKLFLVDNNGLAFLAGDDAWSELGASTKIPEQAMKLTVMDLAKRSKQALSLYENSVRPLLRDMSAAFQNFSNVFASHCADAAASCNRFSLELSDAIQMTSVRANQVFATYEAFYSRSFDANVFCPLLSEARKIADRRRLSYRLAAARYVGWDPLTAPTAYHHRYLWAADQAYFMWRDTRRAYNVIKLQKKSWLSPCVMNFIDPLQIAGIGEGSLDKFIHYVKTLLDKIGFLQDIDQCLGVSSAGIQVPDTQICPSYDAL
jgi:hypothetical protein